MTKKTIHVGFAITLISILILFFQNCGQTNGSRVLVDDNKIIVDDLYIVDEDCSAENTCKVTAQKVAKKRGSSEPQPTTEYDFSRKALDIDKDIPTEFYKRDSNSEAYQKCLLVNRLDDIHYEYLCSNNR